MHICGIDPGINGGITILNSDGGIDELEVFDCPNKIFHEQWIYPQLENIFSKFENLKIIIEHPTPRPTNGCKTLFSSGMNYSILRTSIHHLQLPYEEVSPITWTKKMHTLLPKALRSKTSDTKAISFLICKKIWPKESFLASNRSKKPHDGLTDSALIAEFGRRYIFNQISGVA